MRPIGYSPIVLALLLTASMVHASERGAMIRGGDLKAQPFVDAATSDRVAASQPVTIVRRQGGWAQVETNGKTGWVRLLNVRLVANTPQIGSPGQGNSGANGNQGANANRGNSGNRGNAVSSARAVRSGNASSLFRTGSSGRTVTTGIKGLGEEDIRNASVNEAEVQALSALSVSDAEAATTARQNGLRENQIEHLKGRR